MRIEKEAQIDGMHNYGSIRFNSLIQFQYDVTVEGLPGGGGEYDVVIGFGWTNGVVMDFLVRYGDRLRFTQTSASAQSTVIGPAAIAIGGLTVAVSLFG